MPEPEASKTQAGRTRRNLVKMGAIALSAALVNLLRTNQAHAASAGPTCFQKSTRIETLAGPRKIEDLAVGDLLPTMFRGISPIQWIAHYSYEKADPSKPWAKDALPVRITRSALAPNVPHSDLYVTKGHAFYIDGVLVPAGSLINGTTIALYDAREYDELEFFHIKFEHHDVIFAEGAPCETLLEADMHADNFDEYFRLHGAPIHEPGPCAPLLSFNGGRSEIRSRARSAVSPWIDRREKIDVIRDRLEERGISLTV
jgi:hypothetical protein